MLKIWGIHCRCYIADWGSYYDREQGMDWGSAKSMVVSYKSTRALLCTIGDAAPQQILEEPKVESKGILYVVSLTQHDLPWFPHLQYPWRWQVFLIGQPIEPLVNPNGNRATLQLEVGKEKIPVSLVHSGNTIVEARPKEDPVEEAMSIIQEKSCSTYLGRRCHSLHQGNRSGRLPQDQRRRETATSSSWAETAAS